MKAFLEALAPGEPDWTLAKALDPSRLPEHIAIIMDGNGRWANRRSLPRVAGHKAGIGPVRSTVESCARLGIQALTLYAFSIENWKRPLAEVETLWRLLRFYLRRELPELQKNDIRLEAIGRLDALPVQVRTELEAAVEATSRNRGLLVNLAINYGGRAELADAVNAILDSARRRGDLSGLRIDEEMISANLYTRRTPDPDLLIRTSGEMRISNFLLWQIAYAELYVTDTLWPDFGRTDLIKAILDFQKRDRRFGGLNAEPQRMEESRRFVAMKRVLTSLILIPLVVWLVILGPPWLVFAAATLCGMLCYREYSGIAAGFGVTELGPVGFAAGLGVLALTGGGSIFLTVLALTGIALAMRSEDLADVLPRASAMLLGVVYVFGPWKCAILLREASPYWLLFALVINWVGDASAYYVGKKIGKHKLAPRISPGKSWEGALASVIAAVAFGVFYLRHFWPEMSVWEAAALSALANAAGQLGDLAESALKRGAGVKDSGTLLPGHGGMLDRVDSTLFTMPVVYVYLRLVSKGTGTGFG